MNTSLISIITYGLRIAGVFGALFCMTKSSTLDYPIWIIPLLYTIGISCCRHNILRLDPGILFFNALMLMRYVATPCAYYNDGYINGMSTTYSYLGEALLLMIYEMIVIFITVELSGRKYINKYNSNNQPVSCLSELKLKNGFFFILVVVALLGYIGATYKSLGANWTIFLNVSYNEFEEMDSLMDDGQGYINIIWQSFSVCLYYFLIIFERNRYEKQKKNMCIVRSLVYTFVFIIISFIATTALTRWYTLVIATASLACLLSLYPSNRKKIGLTIMIPLLLLMVMSSFIKNGGFEKGSTNMTEAAEGTFGATNMDVYFNGCGNVSNAMILSETHYDIDFLTIFIDACKNMPIVTHYIPHEKSSIVAFQKVTGRKDQILPLLNQSSLYFGFIFAPLLTLLNILLIRKFDFKFHYDYSYTKFAFSFASVWIGSIAMCLNLTIFFMWVYVRVIPFYLILWYVNKKSIRTYIVSNE